MLKLFRSAFGKDTQFIVYDQDGDAASQYYPNVTFRKWLYFSKQQSGQKRRWKLFRSLFRTDPFYLGVQCVKYRLPFIARLFLTPAELQDVTEYSSADLIVSTGGT